MSAFRISEHHLGRMVGSILAHERRSEQRHCQYLGLPGDERSTLSMLDAANKLSLETRYPNHPEMWPEQDVDVAWGVCTMSRLDPLPLVDCLKALACYVYQSCEHPGFYESPAGVWCERAQNCLVGWLPGYDAAAWDLDETAAVRS